MTTSWDHHIDYKQGWLDALDAAQRCGALHPDAGPHDAGIFALCIRERGHLGKHDDLCRPPFGDARATSEQTRADAAEDPPQVQGRLRRPRPAMTYLTTAQAAAFFGVSPVTIRQWKMLGYLTPINPRQRPSLYRESDLWRRKADLRPPAEHAALDAAWTQIQREG